MMTAAQIRQQYLDFFASKQHAIVPSAPIVVKNDPTLLFTNAGMNQFKDFFLGNRTPTSSRIADTQKCLRVSGKHNDLEEVGVDTYHHTMFEMLGNWSFGDYFKKEAIAWSWELLAKVYGIPKDRLYVTIFEGDAKENLPKDEEAYNEWKKVIAEDRILLGNKKDNFWEMGDTGPCGPCTEIHVDCRSDEERKAVDGKTLVNNDHPQVIEIWNNVFIQFNRLKDGSLESLPAKHVDTGMGLERLVRVLQNKQSNYDTDLFTGTIAAVESIVNRPYKAGDDKESIAFRVLADHIRAICFTIADGQLPSNTGAGYVIRRILRRAVRYYYSYLDYKQPLLHQLVPVLATQFETVFAELKAQESFVQKVVKEEEDAFLRTLDKGLKRIDDIITNAAAGTIEGKAAFELFDTYGFPIDLTRLIAMENNLAVDEAGFEAALNEQKQRSRAATSLDTEDWVVLQEGENKFVGYDSLETKASVLKYRKVKAKGKESYQFVLSETPFYAESGGQVGDKGVLQFGREAVEVFDTKKENDLIIHFTASLPAEVTTEVTARVDAVKRKHTAVHHSATHLMHAALRQVLGTHVAQKGSLVNEEHLRFDFSHFAKVSDEELAKVEALVNEKIRENSPVVIKSMPKEEAIAMGAMALFGEKYADEVRVVIMDAAYSIELCGGTHVGATGELGLFKIKSESAVAAGVRRVEAVTGWAAEQYVNSQSVLISEIRERLKNPKDIIKGIEDLLKDRAELEKSKESLEKLAAHASIDRIVLKRKDVNGVPFYNDILINVDLGILKKIQSELKQNFTEQEAVILLIGKKDSKVFFLLAAENKTNFDCNKIIKEHIAPLIKGGGGGQKTLATAVGEGAGNLNEVIEKIKELL